MGVLVGWWCGFRLLEVCAGSDDGSWQPRKNVAQKPATATASPAVKMKSMNIIIISSSSSTCMVLTLAASPSQCVHTRKKGVPKLLLLTFTFVKSLVVSAVCASGWYGVTSYATKQASCNMCPGSRPVSAEGARSASDCKACPTGEAPNEIFSECGTFDSNSLNDRVWGLGVCLGELPFARPQPHIYIVM